MISAYLSKAGGRRVNEDYCDLIELGSRHCWVIADGLGGHSGGQQAAKLAAQTVVNSFTITAKVCPEAIHSYLQKAHEVLLQRQKVEGKPFSHRTTIVVLVTDGKKALWGHIGDSRLYFFRNGQIRVQTKDHSVSQAMANAGKIKQTEIRFHEDRSKLLRALGAEGDFRPVVEEEPVKLKPGDVFLLCTDGFWEYVTEEVMLATIDIGKSPFFWLQRMEERLLQRAKGEHDNYSAFAIYV